MRQPLDVGREPAAHSSKPGSTSLSDRRGEATGRAADLVEAARHTAAVAGGVGVRQVGPRVRSPGRRRSVRLVITAPCTPPLTTSMPLATAYAARPGVDRGVRRSRSTSRHPGRRRSCPPCRPRRRCRRCSRPARRSRRRTRTPPPPGSRRSVLPAVGRRVVRRRRRSTSACRPRWCSRRRRTACRPTTACPDADSGDRGVGRLRTRRRPPGRRPTCRRSDRQRPSHRSRRSGRSPHPPTSRCGRRAGWPSPSTRGSAGS